MTGRDRRLNHEYSQLQQLAAHRDWMTLEVTRRNAADIPTRYRVTYHIRSFCAVENVEKLGTAGIVNPPVYADRFVMEIDIPRAYPSIDAMPSYRFLTMDDEGNPIPHPWHPNIRWFGVMAGRVCLNSADTYTDIAWNVERVARYLRYEIYHAVNEPPYPEDQQVAAWVVRQGEPQGWLG